MVDVSQFLIVMVGYSCMVLFLVCVRSKVLAIMSFCVTLTSLASYHTRQTGLVTLAGFDWFFYCYQSV